MKHGILGAHASLISFFTQFVDLLAIPLIFWGIFSIMDSHMIGSNLPVSVFLGGGAASVFFQFTANVRGLYISMRGESLSNEIIKCAKYWTFAFLLGTFTIYTFTKSFNEISYAFIFWYFAVLAYFFVMRSVSKLLLYVIRRRGFNQRNVVIVGAGEVGVKLANSIFHSDELGLNVIAFYDDNINCKVNTDQENLKIAGSLIELVNDAKLMKVDRIYITLSMRHMPYIKQVISALSDSTCSVILVPDMFSFDLLNSRMGRLNGIPTISIYDTPMEGANRLVKRLEDFILSLLILILISPILLLIAVAIKLTSPGPILFKQNRYGIEGQKINVYKFRSMTAMDNGDRVVQAQKGDARITPLGSFLRRTSLDELPQFINVLQGNMSIVGPRPHAVAHNEEYRRLIGGYMLRHKVKPGITGWAQINGWRGETDTLDKMQKRVDFDLNYISNWSLIWDLKIIFLTIFKGFINKNAY